jgi:signal peptidase I
MADPDLILGPVRAAGPASRAPGAGVTGARIMTASGPPNRTSGSVLLVAYTGISMRPTLEDAEVVEITPLGLDPVRVGDVIYFKVPGKEHWVIHRVIRILPKGIVTRGDNNPTEDVVRLQRSDIIGRVAAGSRGQQRHGVRNGRAGYLLSRWFRLRSGFRRSLVRVFRPSYFRAARWEFWPFLLPRRWRPRLVVFQSGPRRSAQLMLGSRRVGFFSPELRRWQIRPPFRLFVNAEALPSMAEMPADPDGGGVSGPPNG